MSIKPPTQQGTHQHLATKARQFEASGQATKAARFYRLAGRQAANSSDNENALTYYGQALALTGDAGTDDRFQALLAQEELFGLLGQVEKQGDTLANLEALANRINSDKLRAQVTLRQATYLENKGEFDSAQTLAQLAARLSHYVNESGFEATALLIIGRIETRRGHYEQAQERLTLSLVQANRANDFLVLGHVQRAMGVLANQQKRFASATGHYKQALTHYARVGDRRGRVHVLSNLGHVEQMQGHLTAALTYWDEAKTLFAQLGDREGQARVLINLSTIHIDTGQYMEARLINEEALQVCRESELKVGQCFARLNLGLVAHYQAHHDDAADHLRQAFQLADALGSARLQGHALSVLAHALTAKGDLDEAENCYWEAVAIWEDLNLPTMLAEAKAGMARLYFQQENIALALAEAEDVMRQIDANPQLSGAEGIIRIYLSCFDILSHVSDLRAKPLLTQANLQFERLLAEVSDETLKASMRSNIVAHQRLLTLVGEGVTGYQNGRFATA